MKDTLLLDRIQKLFDEIIVYIYNMNNNTTNLIKFGDT